MLYKIKRYIRDALYYVSMFQMNNKKKKNNNQMYKKNVLTVIRF